MYTKCAPAKFCLSTCLRQGGDWCSPQLNREAMLGDRKRTILNLTIGSDNLPPAQKIYIYIFLKKNPIKWGKIVSKFSIFIFILIITCLLLNLYQSNTFNLMLIVINFRDWPVFQFRCRLLDYPFKHNTDVNYAYLKLDQSYYIRMSLRR